MGPPDQPDQPDQPGEGAGRPSADLDLAGRRAVVTGAGIGIGRATARLFALRGARVWAVDVSPEVMRLSDDLPEPVRARIEPRIVDLADSTEVDRLARDIADRAPYDAVDTLVNCAAAYPPGGLLDSQDADWVRVLAVNVVAASALCRAMARRLIDLGRTNDPRRTASIVNVGSVQEGLPLPGHAAYVASKGALTALTYALAVELGDHQIRVNEVAPGVVDSPSARTKLGGTGWADGPPPPSLLGRSGTVDEVADAIAYLASDAASFITGAVLAVDGGRRLSRRRDIQVEKVLPTDPRTATAPVSTRHVVSPGATASET
ncbi:SDR family oxidoreductase [Actinopolymorpha sp. B11F2]|uniref:SDR family NAD(P)-dependent oxidoreductase n=1 Tax=Actinopolymorpha sp. B11F2 TaxID=3160862 RepID=UPI0032E3A9E9